MPVLFLSSDNLLFKSFRQQKRKYGTMLKEYAKVDRRICLCGTIYLLLL